MFVMALLLISSVLHKTIVGPVFKPTRSSWPFFVIYGSLAMAVFAAYGSTPTDIMPTWSSQGNEEFGLELAYANAAL